MKTQLYICILAFAIGAQLGGCKTSYPAAVAAQYPDNIDLHSGNYGTRIFIDNSSKHEVRAKERTFEIFCDTIEKNFLDENTVVYPPVSSSLSAAAYMICIPITNKKEP